MQKHVCAEPKRQGSRQHVVLRDLPKPPAAKQVPGAVASFSRGEATTTKQEHLKKTKRDSQESDPPSLGSGGTGVPFLQPRREAEAKENEKQRRTNAVCSLWIPLAGAQGLQKLMNPFPLRQSAWRV